MSTVYDLYQSYLNQLQNPVTQSPVVNYNPLLYLQQQNLQQDSSGDDREDRITNTNNAGINSFSDLFNSIKQNTNLGGVLGSLATGNIFGALAGNRLYDAFTGGGGGIMNTFKNFQDRRAGRLDVTADAGIMPTGKQIGALTTADDYGYGSDGGRSADQQSFSDSQSYGGGGTMDDMGADSFI